MLICCVLNNNFSYTQLYFAFVPQKYSYFVHDDTDAFFLFPCQKDFDICLKPFFIICLFLLHKDFDIFRMLLFGTFLCFLIIFYKKIFSLVFLYDLKINLKIGVI